MSECRGQVRVSRTSLEIRSTNRLVLAKYSRREK